jgi:hypothetical protein
MSSMALLRFLIPKKIKNGFGKNKKKFTSQ